jgi:hypothetical protein
MKIGYAKWENSSESYSHRRFRFLPIFDITGHGNHYYTIEAGIWWYGFKMTIVFD